MTQGPRLSYRDIYDPEVGQIPGVEVWEIENFLPNPLDEYAFGKVETRERGIYKP